MFKKLFGKPSPDRFASIVTKAIRKSGVQASIAYNSDEFALTIGQGEEASTMFLGNTHADYCRSSAAERKELINRMVAVAVTPRPKPPGDFESAKPNVFPRVRDRCYYETLRMRHRLEVPTKLIADHLAVELIYDFPDSVLSVTSAHLEEWGASFEEVLAVARENLWKISNQPFDEPTPGVFVSAWQDNHDASRLFLHDLIWQLNVTGTHVAMIPHRDRIIVTGSDDKRGLSTMAELTEELFHDSRALTAIPVRLDGSEWATYRPDNPALSNLRAHTVAKEYSEQKEMLDKQHERAGEGPFVAAAMLIKTAETGEIRTRAAWAEGVDTSLPVVDSVVFVGEGRSAGGAAIVEWNDAVAVVGSLMISQRLYPERFRVTAFPDREQFAALRLKGGRMV